MLTCRFAAGKNSWIKKSTSQTLKVPCTLFQIKRLKSLQESSNKLKQEKWVDEKTRRIKEQTVRGLEPEIQRLMARHTAELANLESEREKQLAAQVTH